MKAYLLIPFIFIQAAFSQGDTDVFLFDLNKSGNNIELSNYLNISENNGYDNQPSFPDNNTLLFVSTRKGQTDIAQYSLKYGSKIWLNYTDGSEYSPQIIPGERAVSAVRLEKDGTQELRAYNLSNGESTLLIAEPIVGYYIWKNRDNLLAAILDEGDLSLVSYFFNENKFYKYQKKIGRSLHKIPGSELISYISKEDPNSWEIKSVNPVSGATKGIMGTLPGSEDMCWLPDGTILMGNESILYAFKPGSDTDWREIADLKTYELNNITRLAVNPDGNKLAVVAEGGKPNDEEGQSENQSNVASGMSKKQAEQIIQEQLEAYNKRDIDAFMDTYSDDVKLYNYPNQIRTDGAQAMRDAYGPFFENTPDLKAVIKNRIIMGNKVIDEEEVTINGKIYNAVAIYELKDGKIYKVTFIQ